MEEEKGIAKENPEYYTGLKTILWEFQEHLISSGIIKNNDYESYIGLLEQIRMDDKKEFDITYNLSDALEGLIQHLNNDGLSVKSSIIGNKYFNYTDSKSFLFNQKMSELIAKKEDLNRSTLANVILQVYDEKDFELPLIKLKIFRFLDPNSDNIMYIYAGRPSPE
ncbi:hypothetical protein [Maribacter arenosus]|uniref:Uncharacterized protein n=1 Tax=Maribacter arenosus TaxID=1854708 RepID=A0ABR7VEL6_9FLAO|nr:hypothetical protein [Maribacter arenosus]MBD0852084.1 hypothetical protein [Maribacter arenosus]